MVEVLAAGVVFLLLMGTLCAGIRFAAGALAKARTVRDSVFQFQQSARRNLEDGNAGGGVGELSFGEGSFVVPVRFRSVQVPVGDAGSHSEPDGAPKDGGKTVSFYLFDIPDTAEGEGGT